MRTRRFWIETFERAAKTAAQTLAAMVTVGATLTDVDWSTVLSISATAAIASVVTSIGSAGIGAAAAPSLVQPRPDREQP